MSAGLVVYKDEHRFARIFWNGSSRTVNFEILNRAKDIKRVAESEHISLKDGKLRFDVDFPEDKMTFNYQLFDENSSSHRPEIALDMIDTAELSGSDFVGPVHGIFAISGTAIQVKFREFTV